MQVALFFGGSISLSISRELFTALRLFLTAHGATAFALGVHQVLLAWLSIGVVGLSASEVGWVQAAGLLPNIALMLVAGVWADRGRPALIMAAAQTGLLVAYGWLAALVWLDSLSFAGLVVYAVGVGCANAFLQPVREKIIGELSRHSLQVKITRASIVQFTLQSLGVLFASLSEQVSLLMVCLAQLGFTALALVSLLQLHRSPAFAGIAFGGIDGHNPMADFRRGLQAAFKDKGVRQLLLLVAFNGFMHMGLFLVAIPVMARDSYGFNAVQYGFLQLSFVVGMLVAYFTLLRQPVLRYPGRGALYSLLYTAIAGYGLSREPTYAGLYLLIIFWGWIAGYSSTHCRVTLQSMARPEQKGRFMSLYQVALFGMAPLGALVTGYAISVVPLAKLFIIMSAASVAVSILLMLGGALWKVEQPAPSETPKPS